MDTRKLRSNRRYAFVIGIGLALFPIHNQWLADITSIGGNAPLFLPVYGTVIWVMATLCYLRDNWGEIDWGDRKVYFPLLIIAGAIALSGGTEDAIGGKIAPFFMGISMFSIYLVSRKLGKDIFIPLAIGAAIASLGVIISQVINPGVLTGGLVFEYNYDIVVGYVLLGAILFIKRYQWVLATLALVSMFLSGSPEGVFAVATLGVVVLWRQDWGIKLAVVAIPLVLFGVIYFSLGYGTELYSYTAHVATMKPTVAGIQSALVYRYEVIRVALANIAPLGDGYNVTAFYKGIVHNVPLIIVQQLGWPGILAGLAWVWVSFWCFFKTKWKYAWALVLALSVFDHYIWTQLAPLWWVIVGVSTSGGIENDLIFRKLPNNKEVIGKRLERMQKVYNSVK